MKRIHKLIFTCVFVLGLAPSTVLAESVLYCTPELVTGITKENGTWRSANFKPERFIVRFNDDFSKLTAPFPGTDWKYEYSCKPAYSHLSPEKIVCTEPRGFSFLYNKTMKRFIFSLPSTSGFLDDGSDTDSMNFGRCESF